MAPPLKRHRTDAEPPPSPHHRDTERPPPPPFRRANRPAFNPLLLSSAFYAGPTAYGGAAARALNAPPKRRHDLEDARARTADYEVRPTERGPAAPISRTAKRILDLLEEYSSPVSDAKRVPRPPEPPLAVRPRPRPGILSAERPSPVASPSTSISPSPARKFRCLRSPSAATLLRLRSPRPTHSAIEASLSSCRPPSSERSTPVSEGRRLDEFRSESFVGKAETRAPRRPSPSPSPIPRETPPPSPPSKKFRFRDPLDISAHRETVAAKATAPLPPKSWNGDANPLPNGEIVKENPPPAGMKKDATLAAIVAEQAKKWECDSCMTRNDPREEKCVCCAAPAPKAKPPAKTEPPKATGGNSADPLMAGILAKQKKMWECSNCLTGNDSARSKCVCCDATKPGSEPAAPTSVLGFNFGSSSGFKFGIDPAPTVPATVENGTGKNAFGVDANGKEPPAAGFKFGIVPEKTASAEPTKPSFGIEKKEDPKPSFPSFTFGVPAEAKKESAIVRLDEKKPDKPEIEKSAPPPSVFGVPASGGTTVDGTSPKTEPIKPTFTFGVPQSVSASPARSTPGIFASTPAAMVSAAVSTSTIASPTISSLFSTPIASPASVAATVPSISAADFKPATSVASTTPSTVPSFVFKAGGETGPSSFGAPSSSAISSWTSPPKTSSSLFGETKPTFGDVKPSFGDAKPTFGAATEAGKTFGDMTSPKPTSLSNSIAFPNLPKAESTTTSAPPPLFRFGEKPKETNGPTPSFSFAAKPTPTTGDAADPFSGANSGTPVFKFGASTAKTETPTLPVFNSLFGAKTPVAAPPKTSAGAFEAPPASANLFSTPSGSLFRPPAERSSTDVFGSGAPKMFFGSPGVASSPPQSTQPSQFGASTFGSNLIFGQNSQPTGQTNALQEKRPESTGGSLFGNAPAQSTPMNNIFGNLPGSGSILPSNNNSSVFGSNPAVPTPVFGASIPFGESNQSQANAVTPFKFGATDSGLGSNSVGFGQAPAAGSSAPVFTFGASAPAPGSQFNFSMGAPSVNLSTPGQNTYPQRRIKKAVRRTAMR